MQTWLQKVLVMVCEFSNYIFSQPTKGETAEETCEILMKWFRREGIPLYVTSDRGSPYIANITQILCTKLGVIHNFGASQSPNMTGLADNSVKMLQLENVGVN